MSILFISMFGSLEPIKSLNKITIIVENIFLVYFYILSSSNKINLFHSNALT